MGRRKREQWPDGFYLLGRKKQQPQSGDEDPKNDQKENGPQAGNVGQQSKTHPPLSSLKRATSCVSV